MLKALFVAVMLFMLSCNAFAATDAPEYQDISLVGIDANMNGVRDDVEAWILGKFSNYQPAKLAATQLATVMQRLFVIGNSATSTDIKNTRVAIRRAMSCILTLSPEAQQVIFSEMQDVIANTSVRVSLLNSLEQRFPEYGEPPEIEPSVENCPKQETGMSVPLY